MARVVLLCNDDVGPRMAGPAVRYWELAGALAQHHEVILATGSPVELEPVGFEVVNIAEEPLDQLFGRADVVFTQLIWPSVARAARRHGVRVIADLYDPILLEELEAFAERSSASRRVRNERTLAKTHMSLLGADAVVCANERQRDLWLGALLALDRVTPAEYDRDGALNHLVSLVPFGLPDVPPTRTGPGVRERLGLPTDALVLLWGGGVWNWFDPLTLLRALALVVAEDPRVHLVFLGLRHPNDRVPEAEMARRTLDLARELGLLGTHVHANEGWTPYDARQNDLLDADVGVSTHFDRLETRFSFRTRMLDYLWAGLPMLVTQGDAFAELVAAHALGYAVPPQDVDALAAAMRRLLADAEERNAMRRRSSQLAAGYAWSRVAAQLAQVVDGVMSAPPRRHIARGAIKDYLSASIREVFVERRGPEALRHLARKLRR